MLWEKLLPRGENLQAWLQRGQQKRDLSLLEPQPYLEGKQKRKKDLVQAKQIQKWKINAISTPE